MNKEILKKAIDTYGEDNQLNMCIEEMSELTKAICKWKRAQNNGEYQNLDKLAEDITEELADVFIMLIQSELIFNRHFNCTSGVQKQMEYKINRLEKRLNNENIS